MKRRAQAVLHLSTNSNANDVLNLAYKVIDQMGANKDVFPNPDPPLDLFKEEANKLRSLISDADTGNHQALSDREGQKRYLLKLEHNQVAYVNRVSNEDEPTILLSGFDVSVDPSPHAVPGKANIRRIEDGSEALTAKILVETTGEPVEFMVQQHNGGPEANDWITVLQTSNSRNLVVGGLERAKEVFFRVAARNARGQGPWSDSVPFIPR